ncbi:cathepsin B-like cysteine proteinase 3 [Bemisia tabaci]|uniref:cathepsin B-like cysteine proteinase 3 n=1 Tax=Bemisia tabaci TaxID=7038 RepID=UPI003B27CC65
MSFDESTIIIPDPARLAREINSAQNSWVAFENWTVNRVRCGHGSLLGCPTPVEYREDLRSRVPQYNAQRTQELRLEALLPVLQVFEHHQGPVHVWILLGGVSGERAFGSAVHSVRGEGERVHIGRESGHLLQVVRQRLQRWQPIKTFKHFTENGEITGGDYGSQIGCKPYSMPPRDNTATMNIEYTEAKKCENKCTNPKYPIPFEKEKRYKTKNYYLFDDRNTTKIQWDLMLNGPQVGAFIVYSDFLLYSKGVYRHTKGVALGGHGVRLIGWGQEKGVDYWLAANSWGTDWGQKGFFKLRRGANECLLEELVVAGEVDLANIHDSPTT